MKILGLDPGLRVTGYGVIEKIGSTLTYITSGCIKTPTGELPDRLKNILNSVQEVIALATQAPSGPRADKESGGECRQFDLQHSCAASAVARCSHWRDHSGHDRLKQRHPSFRSVQPPFT